MSANKKENKEAQETELTGLVVQKKIGAGSKSEHNAICLQTEKGDYILRRVGGNPFQDDALQQWVGKTITASGKISDYTFFAKKLTEIKV
jgi:hypothetical protein